MPRSSPALAALCSLRPPSLRAAASAPWKQVTSRHVLAPAHTRACRVAALCILALLAACGRERAADLDAGAVAADSAQADTSAMAVARRALGPEVRMAIPFAMPGRDTRFIAAALPVMQWVDDLARSGNSVAPGGHEMVVLELRGEGMAVQKPGLYASRAPFLPAVDDTATAPPADSAALARMMGVEDANGDGDPEVWAAQYGVRDGGGHTWDLRAYDRGGPAMYQLIATSRQGTGVDVSAHSFSASAAQNPAMRQWLAGKVQELEAALAASPAGAGR